MPHAWHRLQVMRHQQGQELVVAPTRTLHACKNQLLKIHQQTKLSLDQQPQSLDAAITYEYTAHTPQDAKWQRGDGDSTRQTGGTVAASDHRSITTKPKPKGSHATEKQANKRL